MQRLIDGRQMLPPEPLELTLAALDQLGVDERLRLMVNCRPYPLFELLRRHGFAWDESQGEDGCCVVDIRRI